jgi:branched-subunit amino acid aminotransferase/4-amino-4-deoxychorismate lyase
MSMVKCRGRISLFHPWLNLERMRFNSEAVGLDMKKFSDQGIIRSAFALAAANGYHQNRRIRPTIIRAGKTVNRFYLRPLLYAESETIGLGSSFRPRLLLTLMPFGEYIRHDKRGGIETLLFPQPRTLQLPEIKTASNYQIGIISRKRMEYFNRLNGEKCAETLFLNSRGRLVEGSGENIGIIRDNEILSPPPGEGAIPGITIRMISILASRMGMRLRFSTIAPADLKSDDCLFLCGNAAGLLPVSSICVAGSDFNLAGKLEFPSARNTALRSLMLEYEKMEIGKGEYSEYHADIDEYLGMKEADDLCSLARHMLSGKRAGRKIRFQSSNVGQNAQRPLRLVDRFGIEAFYGAGNDS